MKDEKCIDIAINVLISLQRKYELELKIKNNILNYSNNICSFSVYLEKHFEFYVCFHLHHRDLRLYDVAKWLGFEDRDIVLLARNQIANEHDVKFVLKNLSDVLDKLLGMLQNKPDLLVGFIEYQNNKNKNQLLEFSLSPIRKAWEARQFEKFLDLVDSNRNIIEQSKSAKMIFKQEAYIIKNLNKKTRDGLREP